MPKFVHNALTPTKVKALLKTPGRYTDGNCLTLVVDENRNGKWVVRVTFEGKRYDLGVGSHRTTTLKKAREKRDEIRQQVASGINPRTARKRRTETPTFAEYAIEWHGQNRSRWGSQKYAEQWLRALEVHAFPRLGDIPINDLQTADIVDALRPIWGTTNETARRVKERIRLILKAATAEGLREGENPASGVTAILPSKRQKVKHHKALHYKEVPAFFARVAGSDMDAAPLLRFVMLTAARSGEARFAEWREIDFKKRLWTIPPERMKRHVKHVVPLSSPALEILPPLKGKESELIFKSPMTGRAYSDAVFSTAFKRWDLDITAHGFRSSFRDWSAEQGRYTYEALETALSHQIPSETVRAYLRTDYLDERKKIMEDWGAYISSEA